MKKVERMQYILKIMADSEHCTKDILYKKCLHHQVVRSQEEFETSLEKLQRKGCFTIQQDTKYLIFKRPYSYVRTPGSVHYNGTTEKVFYEPPTQYIF
ncbi:MAG: hypothetical protein Q4G58_11830 [bacterium]|nr:hypothetical protein [bacterium]